MKDKLHGNTLAIALASMLFGGVAVAAWEAQRTPQPPANATVQTAALAPLPLVAGPDQPVPAGNAIAQVTAPAYAEVLRVRPVRASRQAYATVLGAEPVRESTTSTTPREVCEDVVVQERLPERDGNVGGTVAGALIGGLVGSRVGDGDGRKAATVGGAVAGGFIGNRIDRRHVGGQVVARNDRQCRTVSDTHTSSRTVAWNVTYRTPDGNVGTLRTSRKPGSRIALGNETRVVGYDVTYRHDGEERTVRMDDRPGPRLPVVDGRVLTTVVAPDGAQLARG